MAHELFCKDISGLSYNANFYSLRMLLMEMDSGREGHAGDSLRQGVSLLWLCSPSQTLILALSFLLNMTGFPEHVRNVAVVGHLHHGKTALMDMLVFETHKMVWDSDHQVPLSFCLAVSYSALQTDTVYGHACPLEGARNLRQVFAHVSRPSK